MPRSLRWTALLLTLCLVAAACGDDDDDETTAAGPDAASESEGGGGGDDAGAAGEVSMDEPLEVAPGTELPLPDCPSDWSNTAGITEDTILLGMSLPESGPVAALGEVDDGARAWFDDVNANDPIDGKQIELVSQDDAYDPARALANVTEMMETNEPFAFTFIIGTPPNLAVHDPLNDACVPQVYNATGLPKWGDPEDYPWTIGGLLAYNTEARMWCNHISQELGEGATVAGLFMDNDLGLAYLEEMEVCEEEGMIELVETARHDPATPDVTQQMTTLAASNADAVVLGTTGAPCPQGMAFLASSEWDPMTLIHGGCESIATYFTPIDPAGEGVLVASTAKDPTTAGDDPDVQHAVDVLEAAGLNPFAGASLSGARGAASIEQLLRAAAEMEGGLNRTNLMRAMWNADFDNPLFVDGVVQRSRGNEDAYLIEAAQISRYRAPAPGETSGRYEPVGEIIDVEGETGVFEG